MHSYISLVTYMHRLFSHVCTYGQDWTGTPISLTYCVHICILMLDPCAVKRTICMHLSQVNTLACVPKCMHTYLHIHYIMNITTAVKKQTHITIW